MSKLERLKNNLRKARDFNSILQKIFKRADVQLLITQMNFEQLNKGKDRLNTVIRTFKAVGSDVYSPYTIRQKKFNHQDFKHVTLKDTGDFRKTFRVVAMKTFMQVKANEQKPDGLISKNVDLTHVFNLNKENQNKLVQYIKPIFIYEVRKIANI